MGKIQRIDSSMPLTIDPFRRDLDKPIMRGVENLQPVSVEGEDVGLFLDWMMQPPWRSLFETDLECIAEREGRKLLSTTLPLATFRYGFCGGGRVAQDENTACLMDRIVAETRPWRDAGADTVVLSGYIITAK